jgi:hypothetical protein
VELLLAALISFILDNSLDKGGGLIECGCGRLAMIDSHKPPEDEKVVYNMLPIFDVSYTVET